MDVRECYKMIGGSYEGVIHRLATEDRVRRFLGMFMKDKTFLELEAAMGAQDWAAAFRAAHTLKGITMNMNLDRLTASTSELTEDLRGGSPKEPPEALFEKVREDYRITAEAVQALLDS